MGISVHHSFGLADKIAQVEGHDWLRDMCVLRDGVHEAIDVHTRQPARDAYTLWLRNQEHRADEDMPTTTGITIYGAGGWHRYFVRGNGEVQFSAYHSHPEGQARALEAGFTLA